MKLRLGEKQWQPTHGYQQVLLDRLEHRPRERFPYLLEMQQRNEKGLELQGRVREVSSTDLLPADPVTNYPACRDRSYLSWPDAVSLWSIAPMVHAGKGNAYTDHQDCSSNILKLTTKTSWTEP